jgi:hypothetical protein
VNGSGKSTAMNMLLPFLLEADVRRIDAAGEQSGVLQSWMLNGRDEPQPQGYLWVEFANGDEHLTCGCGIRANRSTGRVTTWWFITERRRNRHRPDPPPRRPDHRRFARLEHCHAGAVRSETSGVVPHGRRTDQCSRR